MNEKTEGDVIKAIDDAMSGVDNQARERVRTWFNLKFSDVVEPKVPDSSKSNKVPHITKTASSKKSAGTKKTKSMFKRTKDLDLRPPSKISASSFADQKNPTNLKQKCVVALYYVSRILEIEAVTTDHVYTFFKELNWPVPSDLFNTLHQAGSEGWLDTSDSDNLKVTLRGENLIEHQLPVEKSKA